MTRLLSLLFIEIDVEVLSLQDQKIEILILDLIGSMFLAAAT